jgi:uncharacterized protein GlcG (DUF336 family)
VRCTRRPAACPKLNFEQGQAYAKINRFSIGKAVVSAGTGLSSGDVEGIVDHPGAAGVVAQGVPAIRIRGGLPILRNGQVEGGCGVHGGSSREQDEECARAGIASILGISTRPRQARGQVQRRS